jgi:glycosyltransferase involved in cell wall biosynthesis
MSLFDTSRIREHLTRSRREMGERAAHAIALVAYREPAVLWLAHAARFADKDLLTRVVRAVLAAHGAAALADWGSEAMGRVPGAPSRRALFIAIWGALREGDVDQAIRFGDAFIDTVEQDRIAATLARLASERGAIERPLEVLRRYPDKAPELLHRLQQEADLLRDGVWLPPPGARRAAPGGRRVVYVLSQSMPHHTSGYAIRSHGMLRHLRALGWQVTGATRFGYPVDRSDHAGGAGVSLAREIDGVPYRFRPDPIGFREPDGDYIARAARALVAQAGELRPAIVHAASNYQVGLAAISAARTLGVPSIYEVRGLWHLTRTSKEPAYADTDHYRMSEALEVEAAREADHVFVITQAVLDLFAERGVARAKMTLLPNAVDLDQFTPRPRDPELAARLGVTGKVVIGTVGTFKWYEGLDLLFEAAASMRRRLGDTFRLLLVGDGPESQRLAELRARLGLEELVVMTGRVPHDQVASYYSLIDVAAYPRTGARVCHFVSPLKPLEAMAMEKAVVVSDVRAQAEMVEDEVTGLVHAADDAAALERALTRLVGDAALRAQLAARARAWAGQHRSWPAAAAAVSAVYERLLAP